MKKVGRIVKTVETSQDNPRNGEGSFIRLNDGGVMLAYSRFGGEGGDHDHSRIVGITSYDEGETWSGERELFNDDYECRNNMACSFVRMPNGEIGACYLRKNNESDGTISCMPVFRYSTRIRRPRVSYSRRVAGSRLIREAIRSFSSRYCSRITWP